MAKTENIRSIVFDKDAGIVIKTDKVHENFVSELSSTDFTNVSTAVFLAITNDGKIKCSLSIAATDRFSIVGAIEEMKCSLVEAFHEAETKEEGEE